MVCLVVGPSSPFAVAALNFLFVCSFVYVCLCFLARFEREAFERAFGRERIEASTGGNVIWHSANMISHRGLLGFLFVVGRFRVLTVNLATGRETGRRQHRLKASFRSIVS